MPNQNQPDRWESSILAFAMALAGTLFFFDKFGSLAENPNILFLRTLLHSAPVLLVLCGLTLLLAGQHRT